MAASTFCNTVSLVANWACSPGDLSFGFGAWFIWLVRDCAALSFATSARAAVASSCTPLICDDRLVNAEANHDGISSPVELGVGGAGEVAEVAAGRRLAVLAGSG